LPLATSLLFAGSFIAGKYTTVDLGPLTTSLLRYLVALIFLALLAAVTRSSLRVRSRDIRKLLLLGLFGIVGYHFFFFSALRQTEVANTAIINALSPIVTGLMAAVFLRERLSRRNYAGVVFAVAGAVLNWAAYALLIKKLSNRYTGLCLFFYAVLFGTIMLLALAFTEGWIRQIESISTASLWSIIYMGAAASGIGYLLYTVSIGRIGPTRTSGLVYSLVPVFVAALALLFFGEPVTPVMMISAGAILLGLRLMMEQRPSS
jgi:drug/metabolite transporter (DMT)-like permease